MDTHIRVGRACHRPQHRSHAASSEPRRRTSQSSHRLKSSRFPVRVTSRSGRSHVPSFWSSVVPLVMLGSLRRTSDCAPALRRAGCGIVFGVGCCGVLLFASPQLHAQTPVATSGFVAGRVGVNAQVVPDGVSGTALGAGWSAGVFVGPRWALEFEAWIPGDIEDPGVRIRTMLFSGSAVRFLAAQDRGPYVLVGLTAARVEWDSSSDVTGSVQAGTGVVVRLGGRISFAPEIRANVVSGGMFIIRPNVAIFYRFPWGGFFDKPLKLRGAMSIERLLTREQVLMTTRRQLRRTVISRTSPWQRNCDNTLCELPASCRLPVLSQNALDVSWRVCRTRSRLLVRYTFASCRESYEHLRFRRLVYRRVKGGGAS